MEPTQETQATPVPEVAVAATPAAPTMISLFKAGWEFVKTRKDIVGWYFLASVLLAAVGTDFFWNIADGIVILGLGAMIAIFGILVFLFLNFMTIVHTVVQEDISTATYSEGIKWSKDNFFAALWTFIIMGICNVIGFMLFIIPGIIVSVYFYFSIYYLATSGEVGTNALKQSYQLVKGRWTQTFWKLVVLTFYAAVVYIAIAIIAGILGAISGGSLIAEAIVIVIVEGIASAAVGIITMYAAGQYFKHLKSSKTPEVV